MKHMHACYMYLSHSIHYRFVSTTVAVIDKVTYKITRCPNELFKIFFISNIRRVLNAICFLLGNSPASEFYMLTFRNTLFNFL